MLGRVFLGNELQFGVDPDWCDWAETLWCSSAGGEGGGCTEPQGCGIQTDRRCSEGSTWTNQKCINKHYFTGGCTKADAEKPMARHIFVTVRIPLINLLKRVVDAGAENLNRSRAYVCCSCTRWAGMWLSWLLKAFLFEYFLLTPFILIISYKYVVIVKLLF